MTVRHVGCESKFRRRILLGHEKKKEKKEKKKKLRTYNILCSCEAESENDRIEGRPQTLLIDMALTDCHGFHGLI